MHVQATAEAEAALALPALASPSPLSSPATPPDRKKRKKKNEADGTTTPHTAASPTVALPAAALPAAASLSAAKSIAEPSTTEPSAATTSPAATSPAATSPEDIPSTASPTDAAASARTSTPASSLSPAAVPQATDRVLAATSADGAAPGDAVAPPADAGAGGAPAPESPGALDVAGAEAGTDLAASEQWEESSGGGLQGPEAASDLHTEIVTFVEAVTSTCRRKRRAKMAALRLCKALIRSLWPRAQVLVFGSFVTGLELPSSDVDVVVRMPKDSQHRSHLGNLDMHDGNANQATLQQRLARLATRVEGSGEVVAAQPRLADACGGAERLALPVRLRTVAVAVAHSFGCCVHTCAGAEVPGL